MKILRGTLTFVLGMVMGVILFIAAIAGTIYAVATSISVGQLQETVGVQIFDDKNEINDKTLWDIGTQLINDVPNLMSLSLNEIAAKYGLKTKLDGLSDISGIDISPIFDVPLSEITGSLNKIVEGITLEDVGELAGIDFGEYGLPILERNLYNSVTKALDEIMSSIGGDNLSLRQIENNFGITLGENILFDMVKDVPLSSFGTVINSIKIGTVIDVNCDGFIVQGENAIFVRTDTYEPLSQSNLLTEKDGASKFVYGTDENDNLIYKELRYKVKTTAVKNEETGEITQEPVLDEEENPVYVVDNSCYDEGYVADEDDTVYYRYLEYSAYDALSDYAIDTEYFVPLYLNFYENDDTSYSLTQKGYISLKNLFSDQAMTALYNDSVSGSTITINGGYYAFYETEGGSATAEIMESYGVNAEILINTDSKMELGGEQDKHLKVRTGTSDAAIQAISQITVKGLNNATDSLMDVKLGDLIEVTDESTAILKALKDTRLKDLSNSIDSLTLSDVIDIKTAFYAPNPNGDYVFTATLFAYTAYDPVLHSGLTRYNLNYTADEDGEYAQIEGVWYLYDADDDRMEDVTRYNRTYSEEVPGDDGEYVQIEKGGYYSLYNAAVHEGFVRYSPVKSALNNDYILASSIQIELGTALYYWNGTAMTAADAAYIAANPDAKFYVEGDASAKVLQRLAFATIEGFSEAFDNIALGDAMDIQIDIYATVDAAYIAANPYDDYYYYEDKLFLGADAAYIAANPDATIYRVAVKGNGNAVLKRLVYTTIEEVANKMNMVIDDTSLSDVVDITSDFFHEDANGIYVYVPQGKYYTLYNAALHGELYARFSLYTETAGLDTIHYIAATAEQIALGTDLYYWNGTAMAVADSVYIEANPEAELYVQGSPSSRTLQRFVNVKIGKFSDEFKNLLLCDVIDINGDIFTIADDEYIAANPDGIYYVYADALYSEPQTPPVIGDDVDYYRVAISGSSHIVLKKMAFLKVDELGARMGEIINSLYLSDLVEINEYNAVAPFDGADEDPNARWIISPDETFTEVVGDDTYRYTFVYDANGKYYRKDIDYVELSASQLASLENGTGVSYSYVAIPDMLTLTTLTAAGNTYFYYFDDKGTVGTEDDEYILSTALALYLSLHGEFENLYYRDATGTDVTNQQAWLECGNLFVDFMGEYVLYDADNPAHVELDKYFLLEDGYYLVGEVPSGQTAYYYNTTTDVFSTTPPTPQSNSLFFIQIPADSDGKYYFVKRDSDFEAAKKLGNTPVTYSKQNCETIYVESLTGILVFYNGGYVSFEEANPEHESLIRYDIVIGYLATINETANYDGVSYQNFLSTNKVSITKAKSAPVLEAFARDKVKISTLDSSLKNFTIGDLMEITPDSMFDDPSLKAATIDSLSTIFVEKMQQMTIEELLGWGNISSLDPKVLAIIGGNTLEDFFGSLVYENGAISVNMKKLYGIES